MSQETGDESSASDTYAEDIKTYESLLEAGETYTVKELLETVEHRGVASVVLYPTISEKTIGGFQKHASKAPEIPEYDHNANEVRLSESMIDHAIMNLEWHRDLSEKLMPVPSKRIYGHWKRPATQTSYAMAMKYQDYTVKAEKYSDNKPM